MFHRKDTDDLDDKSISRITNMYLIFATILVLVICVGSYFLLVHFFGNDSGDASNDDNDSDIVDIRDQEGEDMPSIEDESSMDMPDTNDNSSTSSDISSDEGNYDDSYEENYEDDYDDYYDDYEE